MPEITGRLSADGRTYGPCVWCGEASDALGITPGRPDLGSVPIHVFCAGAVLVAYRRWRSGLADVATLRRMEAYTGRLLAIADGRKAAAELDQAVAEVSDVLARAVEEGPRVAEELRDALAPMPEKRGLWIHHPRGCACGRCGLDEELRREIESRNRAFAGDRFAVGGMEMELEPGAAERLLGRPKE